MGGAGRVTGGSGTGICVGIFGGGGRWKSGSGGAGACGAGTCGAGAGTWRCGAGWGAGCPVAMLAGWLGLGMEIAAESCSRTSAVSTRWSGGVGAVVAGWSWPVWRRDSGCGWTVGFQPVAVLPAAGEGVAVSVSGGVGAQAPRPSKTVSTTLKRATWCACVTIGRLFMVCSPDGDCCSARATPVRAACTPTTLVQ